MSQIHEINQIDDLDAHQLCWRSLLQQTRQASFFQSLDWLRCYWRHFGQGQKLRVLIVTSGGAPIGILPLTVIPENTRIGTVRVLTYPLHDWGTFYGPLGPNPAATLTAGLRHIKRTSRDWDLVDLRWVDRVHDGGRTSLAMQMAGLGCLERRWKSSDVIDLRLPWDEYVASRSGKFRNNLRRAERSADRSGGVTFHRYRPAGAAHGDNDPRWDLFDQCCQVARRSWQGSSQSGTTLCHSAVEAFFRDTHEAAVHAGACDVASLRHDGRMIAFAYNYCWGGNIQGVRIGYDPEYAHLSPGVLLLARMIQDSHARGDQFLDLGPDPADYKSRWRTATLTSYRYAHYAAVSPRGQLLRLKHRLMPA